MEIYKIIEEIMSEENISIAEIARKCGLHDSTVRGIITRKQKTVALDVAFKLSDGLGISLERLNGQKEKAPAVQQELPQEDITMEQSTRLLVGLGFIREGEQISDRDLAFLSGILNVLDAYFDGRK